MLLELPFETTDGFVHASRLIGLFLRRQGFQVLAISCKGFALLPHLLIDLAQPKVGRRIIRIISCRFFVTAERTSIVFPVEVEVANLNRLPWRGRNVMERFFRLAGFRQNVLPQQWDRQARESESGKEERNQNCAHNQIFHRAS